MIMKTIKKEISINASAKKIVDFISNPKNMAIVLPHVIRNYNISKGSVRPGFSFDWEYSMMGVPFKGKWKITKYEYPTLYVAETDGMIKSTWTYNFAEKDGKTTWKVAVAYDVPKKLLGSFSEGAIIKINEKDLERFLHSTKVLLEQ